MPQHWEHPEELFTVQSSVSKNSTINFAEALLRKANILNNEYKGTRQPLYLRQRNSVSAEKPQEIYKLGRQESLRENKLKHTKRNSIMFSSGDDVF
jgi:hypothetical protein